MCISDYLKDIKKSKLRIPFIPSSCPLILNEETSVRTREPTPDIKSYTGDNVCSNNKKLSYVCAHNNNKVVVSENNLKCPVPCEDDPSRTCDDIIGEVGNPQVCLSKEQIPICPNGTPILGVICTDTFFEEGKELFNNQKFYTNDQLSSGSIIAIVIVLLFILYALFNLFFKIISN